MKAPTESEVEVRPSQKKDRWRWPLTASGNLAAVLLISFLLWLLYLLGY